jgi:MFS family permease
MPGLRFLGPRMTDTLEDVAPAADLADAHRRRHWALLVLCAAQLMMVLDFSIVNVALPEIGEALHFSEKGLQWVISAYGLTFGGFLLLGGRACDLFGRRRLFVGGLALFTAASLLGGLARAAWMLIAARALQGVGGAVIVPAILSLITATFPEGPERNRAMGWLGTMSTIGFAVGMILGGVLTDALGWASVMFVNVPAGLAVVLAAPVVLPAGRTEGQGGAKGFDVLGALLVTGAASALVYGLSTVAEAGWTAVAGGALAAAAVQAVAFVLVESVVAHPLVPLSVFTRRNMMGANLVGFFLAAAAPAMVFLLTIYLQKQLHYSPFWTGMAFMPHAAAAMAASHYVAQGDRPVRGQAGHAGRRPAVRRRVPALPAGRAGDGLLGRLSAGPCGDGHRRAVRVHPQHGGGDERAGPARTGSCRRPARDVSTGRRGPRAGGRGGRHGDVRGRPPDVHEMGHGHGGGIRPALGGGGMRGDQREAGGWDGPGRDALKVVARAGSAADSVKALHDRPNDGRRGAAGVNGFTAVGDFPLRPVSNTGVRVAERIPGTEKCTQVRQLGGGELAGGALVPLGGGRFVGTGVRVGGAHALPAAGGVDREAGLDACQIESGAEDNGFETRGRTGGRRRRRTGGEQQAHQRGRDSFHVAPEVCIPRYAGRFPNRPYGYFRKMSVSGRFRPRAAAGRGGHLRRPGYRQG